MPRFVKRPVEIEARQWKGETPEEFLEWIGSGVRVTGESLLISTLEGIMEARPNDWVIRGVQGEFYPCKPEIFNQTYEYVRD